MAVDSRSPQSSQDAQNNRVTMAVLKKDIDHIIAMLREDREETRTWRKAAEERVRMLETQCQRNITEIARLEERQKSTTGILGVFTLIASTVAGAIGAVVK